MRNFTALFICSALALLFTRQLSAQPLPCGPDAEMTPTCEEACIICNIDGFTGFNNSSVTGVGPAGFCTTQFHNIQWIAFQAGSVDLSMRISVSNCQTGLGLEIGLYESLDCENFSKISFCDTDVQEGESQVFTNTVPLEIGQYYYLVIDGSNHDICQYNVQVLSGSTQVDPLDQTGAISGPSMACPGQPLTYTSAPVQGATEFTWTMDGVVAPSSGNTINLAWATPGTHELCVKAFNACSEATPVCTTVEVTPLPPTEYSLAMCPGNCIPAENTLLCQFGTYDFHYTAHQGCDSTVLVHVTQKPAVTATFDLAICSGASFKIGNEAFTTTGQYQRTLTNWEGCDSIVNLNLTVVECEIMGNVQIQGLTCTGNTEGSISFSLTNGTPPFDYTWQRLNSTPAFEGQGVINALNTPELLDQLPPGLYFITIYDHFGNDLILNFDIAEVLPLVASISSATYHGFQVSCNGGDDGQAAIFPTGGSPPYTYLWNDGNTQNVRSALPAGLYQVTVSDRYNCTFTTQATLTEPTALTGNADYKDPACFVPESGAVEVIGAQGGVSPYQYQLYNQQYEPLTAFTQLSAGAYYLVFNDANQCTDTIPITLTAPVIPLVKLPADTSVALGAQVSIEAAVFPESVAYIWSDTTGFNCHNCLDPLVRPLYSTAYTITVTSVDGCSTADTMLVRVRDERDIYVPNAFTPNSSDNNARLLVFGGDDVALVRSFQVYSRWGGLVFERQNILPNHFQEGWDGLLRGRPMPPGVYVWQAEIEFIDKSTLHFKGNTTLIR